MLHQVYTSARGGSITNQQQDFSIGSLLYAVTNERERDAILILKALKLSDILAYRVVYVASSTDSEAKTMNIFHFAVIKGMKSLVKYILEEHRYISSSNRQLKTVDPRIILAPLGKDYPQIGTLELAV